MFPEAKISMISVVTNRRGNHSDGASFVRSNEFMFIVQFGSSRVSPVRLDSQWRTVQVVNRNKGIVWHMLTAGMNRRRVDAPNLFYPFHIINTDQGPVFHSVGEPFYDDDPSTYEPPNGTTALFPYFNGQQGRWLYSSSKAPDLIAKGYLRLGKWKGDKTPLYYLTSGVQEKIEEGTVQIIGRRSDGSVIDDPEQDPPFIPSLQWNVESHDVRIGGSDLLKKFLPDRAFPYPKSLHLIEDVLRFFVSDNPDAVIVDFFGGSGTTLHATMRLNAEDGGHRQCILVTNNEVSSEEEQSFTAQGLRPGDPEWESYGICDYITKPRIRAAVTGVTSTGEPVKGEYKYNRTAPMSDGLSENVQFFTLTYPSRAQVEMNTVYDQIAPVLWMKAGSRGDILTDLSDGYAVNDHYAVLSDMDSLPSFCAAVDTHDSSMIYVLTTSESTFRHIASIFPDREVRNGITTYLHAFDGR